MPVVTMTTFQVHHSHQKRLLKDRLGDGANSQGLAGPGSGHDPEPLARSSPLAQLGAMLPLQQRVHLNAERHLDRLASRSGRRDDDDTAFGMGSVAVSVGIGWKVMVAGRVHA
jgi:hypothetical protein